VEPLRIEIVEGPGAGQQVPVDGPLVIGRSPDAEVVLQDGQVSRRHARVTPAEGGALVEDLGSSNGTLVNHEELHSPVLARPGDDIQIGVTVLELRSDEQVTAQPSAVRPVPPALATPERPPTYVGRAPVDEEDSGSETLEGLIDVKVKGRARLAPLAVFILAVLVVLIYLATR
jgi:pSer/pThr/pTyr-binding forkhead associated (FHA) protein